MPQDPNTLLVDIDTVCQWAKLFSDCFSGKICLPYSLVTGLAAHAKTDIRLIGTETELLCLVTTFVRSAKHGILNAH